MEAVRDSVHKILPILESKRLVFWTSGQFAKSSARTASGFETRHNLSYRTD